MPEWQEDDGPLLSGSGGSSADQNEIREKRKRLFLPVSLPQALASRHLNQQSWPARGQAYAVWEKLMRRQRLSVPLNPIHAFAVAARHKTFTAAAKELGVSQVAVSRQIATLENYLNVSLFERGTRSAKLTDVGRAFGLEVVSLFDELERAAQRLVSRESENTVTVRVHPTVAHYWLLPRLGDFKRKFPDVRVRFDTRVEPLDFRGMHLDFAVQLGDGNWKDARARKLFDEEIDVVCSAQYLSKNPPLAKPEDVAEHELLHARYRRRAWEFWSNAVEVSVDFNSGTEFDTSLLAFSAAQHGLGLAIGQLGVLDDAISEGCLVRPFQMRVPTGAAFYVIWPTLTSVNINAKRCIDWLLDEVGQPREFFTTPASTGNMPAGIDGGAKPGRRGGVKAGR